MKKIISLFLILTLFAGIILPITASAEDSLEIVSVTRISDTRALVKFTAPWRLIRTARIAAPSRLFVL